MRDLLELLVDGEPCAAGWPMDRGLLYGDGLFETMQVRGGSIRFEADHRGRLAEGCRRLSIPIDLEPAWLQVRAAAARHPQALLRLQVTRGEARARGYAPSGTEQARVIVAAFAPSAALPPPEPVRAVSLAMRLGENPALAGLKHCNRLEQVLARQELAGTGAFEGLLASSSGALISGTMSNVFFELDARLLTPSLSRCGVAGVLRAALLREAGRIGMPINVAELPLAALARCSALALTNARLGVLHVHELDGRKLQRSPRLAELGNAVERL